VDAAGHALLATVLLGLHAGGLQIAIQFGTALAILVYLWRDVGLIGQGLLRLRKMRVEPGTQLLARAMAVAAPGLIARAWFSAPAALTPADLATTGFVIILVGLAMGIADRLCMTVKRVEHLGMIDALILGASQLLAFLPGIGRLAAGLLAARLLGFERPAAYRFLLLADAALLLTGGGSEGMGALLRGKLPESSDLLAGSVSFVLTLTAVALAVAWIRRVGLLPFAIYRLLLGVAMIALAVAPH